jgi:predicted PurR-regulated permease PerM
MVRIQYKLNDRYSKVMGINEATGKGNFLHSLVSTEVEPVLGEVNRMLKLNSSKREAFLRYYGGVEGFKPIEERFYQYLLANEKNQKKEERNEIEKNLRDPASTGEVDSEPKENQSGFVSILYSAVSIWLVMPFVFFFLLIDNGRIEKYFLRFVPNHYFELALTTIGEADGAIGRYLRGTLLECSLVGLTLSLGLFLIGVPPQVSLLIGIIAGLTNAIPFLGPLIGLVVGLFYALIAEEVRPILPFVNLDNLFIAVISVVAVAQLLDNAVFQPIVLGSAVNLHPLVVILGVVGGGSAFGFVGMLLAIPTIVVCKEVLSTIFRELRAYRLI